MNCVFCLIGSAIGGAIGGPAGAFFGFWIGGVIGGIIGNSDEEQAQKVNFQAQRQQEADNFFEALMMLSAHVILADGKIMHSEMETVRNFLRVNGFNETMVLRGDQLLKSHFDYYKTYGQYSWENRVRTACYNVSATLPVEYRIQLISYLAEIAKADKKVDTEEIDAIHFIAANLGLDPSIADQFLSISDTYSSLEDAYKVFGIASTATDDEVRKAYRKLVLQYHPDKVAHLGEEAKANATRKLQEINKARDLIFQSRGIK